MTLRQYLLLMATGTALLWAAVGAIVAAVDPFKAPGAVFAVFYATLYLALTGTFAVIGFLLRIALLRQQLVVSRHVAVSFRQALLLALFLVIALALNARNALTWWNVALAIAGLTVIESFFISGRHKPRQ